MGKERRKEQEGIDFKVPLRDKILIIDVFIKQNTLDMHKTVFL